MKFTSGIYVVRLIASLLVVCTVCCSCNGSCLAHLSAGHNRVIDVRAAVNWEVSRGFYYEVRDAGRVITPKTFFEYDDGSAKHSYSLVFAERQELVGVVENGVLVIIQDFQSGESWPRLRDDEVFSDPAVKAKWMNVFKRLKAENPRIQPAEDFEDKFGSELKSQP